MSHEIEGRRGYFLVVNEDGFESDILTPENADNEASRLLFDASRKPHKLHIIWRFHDMENVEEGTAPTSRMIGPVGVASKLVFWDEQGFHLQVQLVNIDLRAEGRFSSVNHPEHPTKDVPSLVDGFVAQGVWQACEEYLHRMNYRPVDPPSEILQDAR